MSAAEDGDASKQAVLVLGAGWVGSRLAQSLLDDGISTIVTNRPGTDVGSKPPYFRPLELPSPPASPCVERREFDLSEPSTWDNLPGPESLAGAVVTFPMVSTEGFWDAYLSKVAALGRPVLVYSSTSVYRVDTPGQTVDERTPLRETPRALGELYMQDRGATILTISGIFGDQRTPRAICTCLSTYTSAGGALNGRKQINMVHVNDIVKASRVCLMQSQRRGQRINVAGHHFFLSQLISHCKHPAVPDAPDTDLSSKCVSSDVLQEMMPEGFDFVMPLAPPQ